MLPLKDWLYIAIGIGVTLQYTFLSLFFGFWMGLLVALLRLQKRKALSFIAAAYISLFRGTPLLVQLSLIYYGSSQLIGCNMSAFAAGITAFSLNSAAYTAEILRSGIQSIDTGQFEACYALRIPSWMMWKDIILPQAIRNALPVFFNEVTSLIKETAIISIIGVADIMHRAQLIGRSRYTYLEPLLIAALYYYVLIFIFDYLSKRIEKRYDYY